MITKENNAILMSYIGDTDMAAPPSEGNPSAWIIFLRDVTRICEYFSLQGVESPPRGNWLQICGQHMVTKLSNKWIHYSWMQKILKIVEELASKLNAGQFLLIPKLNRLSSVQRVIRYNIY